jgi:hypothetical protein
MENFPLFRVISNMIVDQRLKINIFNECYNLIN